MTMIREALRDFNPWWKGEFNVEFKERAVYRQLQKFLPLPHIIAFTGLRRVGKTTLMLKIAEDFIKEAIDPMNVLYFSFDEFHDAGLREVVKNYEELVEKDVRKGKYVMLFDEIQKLTHWEEQLKSFYDLFGKNVKIVISGSESLFIRKKSKEALAGRMFEFKVTPLSFNEFLVFRGMNFNPVGVYEKELKKAFTEFMVTLGFPELVNIKDKDIIKKYVREGVVEKVVYRDLPGLFKIKDVSRIETILNIFMEEPGQLIEISKLAHDLKISRQTLAQYLTYLEESFLLRKLYNFSRSRRKVERKLKKYYPTIVSVDLLFRDDEHSQSKVFEWMVVQELNAEFFWRDPYKNEVDIILTDGKIEPVEVKYGKLDVKGLLVFMEKFKITEGYIISFEKEETQKVDGKTIYVIPAFKFLLQKLKSF